MSTSSSISNEIIKRSFKISLYISIVLFLILSLTLFSLQINQKHQSIEQKLDIDSEFIVNAIKVGDLFFITKYLSAFVSSGSVVSCGIKAKEEPGWVGISPGQDFEDSLRDQGILVSFLSTTVSGFKEMGDQNQSSWNFYYSYKINHFFYIYAAMISFFLSILIFLFLKTILKQTASFFSEPVENLYKDLDNQISNPTGEFQTLNYNKGQRFQETDRFVVELDQLLNTIDDQNDKIKEAEVHEALSRLGRQVNHDIQSPLGALKTAIEQIDNNRTAAVNLLNKSVVRIQSIVADLKIRKEEVSSLSFQGEKVEFNQFIQQLVREKQAEYKDDVEFSCTTEKTDIYLEIDRGKMARAISNIINNGIEAVSEKKPHILIQVFSKNQIVELHVTDNGPGIPESVKEKIFDYGVTFGKKNGTGTGLSQAIETLKLHKGSIYIDPNSVEGENTIILTLSRTK